jgi:hypothetical protein
MIPDTKIEAWMGMVQHQLMEMNKKLGRISILLQAAPKGRSTDAEGLLKAISSLGGDLSPEELIKKAHEQVEKKEKEAENAQKAESTHVEHKCPACGRLHVWDIHPYTEPGSKFADYVRTPEERKDNPLPEGEKEEMHFTEESIQGFVESQLCENCETPMTQYVNQDRAQQPHISVADMYGIKPENTMTDEQKKAAAAKAVDPTVAPATPAPAATKAKPKAKPKPKAAPKPKKKRPTRRRKKK